MADIEYAQTTYFEEITQHRRTTAFQHFRAGTEELDRIIGNQAVTARNQLQCQFALTQAGLSGNEYAHFKYIQKYAVLDGGSSQCTLQINPQNVHQVRAFLLGSQQGDTVGTAIIAQFGRNRQAVGDNDQRHGDIEKLTEIVVELARFQAAQIFGFSYADNLNLVGMDKV
ncbi:Uncharacterised protein [Mycobacteroides abscessus subsp. massiliense]|nr:Uncharacterised protein [Mycobacteroides abscessus subsp. massiliense]